LLCFDDVPHDVLSVLHVHLEHLDGFTLSLDLFNHLLANYLLQIVCPVVIRLLGAIGSCWHTSLRHDHPTEENLYHDQQVLMSKEHKVLKRGVDSRLMYWVDIWVRGMCEEMEELDKPANSH
jgi:hypothetical protein